MPEKDIMKKYIMTIGVLLSLMFISSYVVKECFAQEKEYLISGSIFNGLRQIEIDMNGPDLDLHVYRGDYVQFLIKNKTQAKFTLESLQISETVPLKTEKSYIKFKELGVFPFTVDDVQGTITVHKLERPNYFEVSAKEAQDLIQSLDLFLLDVRTEGEFREGHLKNAYLSPVGDLQNNLKKIADYKDKPVLIYCRSGNRSTVAAKILLDNGFKRIYNMRYGIIEWNREKFQIVK